MRSRMEFVRVMEEIERQQREGGEEEQPEG